MPAGFSVNELRIHAHALSRLADAPFEHVAHAELASDLFHVNRLALEREGGIARDHERAGQPRQLGGEIFGQAIDEIVLISIPSEICERQDHDRQLGYADRADRYIGACPPGHGTLYRIGSHRPRNVLQVLLAHVDELGRDLVLDLMVRRIGDGDAARLRDAFEPGRDVHPIAQDVIAFDQHVTEIDADAEQHSPILRQTCIPLCHEFLNRDGALDRGNDRGKFHQHAIASALDDPAAMAGHDRIDGGSMLPESPRCARLIDAHQPAVASDIGGQDGGQSAFDTALPRCTHGSSSGRYSTLSWRSCRADREALADGQKTMQDGSPTTRRTARRGLSG